MIDQVISHPTAKLAKEKKFNEFVFGYITEYHVTQVDEEYPDGGGPFSMTKGEIEYTSGYFKNNSSADFSNTNYTMYAAPTQSLLVKWLRETHNIQVWVMSMTKDGNGKYRDYIVYVNGMALNDPRDEEFQTYEEALEVGLEHALKMI